MEQKIFRFGRPIGTRLIVQADAAADQTPGGLFIPEMAKERPQFGTVLVTGTGVTEKINDGDRVMFGKHAGTPLVIAEITYFIMQEREIFMILDQEELDKATLSMATKKPAIVVLLLAANSSFYKVGSDALINIPAEVGGNAAILVYNGKKLVTDLRHSLEAGDNIFKLPVTEGMFPEIRLDVTVSEKNNTTKRGTLALEIIKK